MKLGVAGRQREGFAKGDDGIVPFFLRNLNVGACAERIEGRRSAGIRAIEFSERAVVLLLLEKEMDEAGACAGVVRINREIIAIRGGSFGLFLRIEGLRDTQQSLRRLRLGVENGAEFGFGFGIFFQAVIKIAKMKDGFGSRGSSRRAAS